MLADYKRLVSYLYQYKNDVKRNNIGYARIESHSAQCKIVIHITMPEWENKLLKVYMFHRNGTKYRFAYLGNLLIKDGIAELKLKTDRSNIMNSELDIEDMCGIVIYDNSVDFLATEWDNRPIMSQIIDDIEYPETMVMKDGTSNPVAPTVQEVVLDENHIAHVIDRVEEPFQEEITEQPMEETPVEQPIEQPTQPQIEQPQPFPVEQPANEPCEQPMEQPTQNSKLEYFTSLMNQYMSMSKNMNSVGTDVDTTQSTEDTDKSDSIEYKKLEYDNIFNDSINEEVKKEEDMKASQQVLHTAELYQNRSYYAQKKKEKQKKAQFYRHIWYNDDVAPTKEVEDDSIILEFNQKKIEKNQKREKMSYFTTPEAAGQQSKKDDEKASNNKIEQEEKSIQEVEKEKEEQLHPIAQTILTRFPKMYPFEDNEVAECVRIEPQDIGLLPIEAWVLGNNSFLLHGYYTYRHLIFGRMNKNKGHSYILGVPGTYSNRERFMARMFGFTFFKPMKMKELKNGDFGYWYLQIILN